MALISDELADSIVLTAECTRNNTYLLDPNIIPDDEKPNWFYSTFQIFIIFIIQPFVSCFGLIGNLSVLALIVYRTEMRTITNVYIGNLAVSDLILNVGLTLHLFLKYFAASGLHMADYTRNGVGCFISVLPFHIGLFSSIGFVVLVISFERFMAICFPVKHRVIASKRRALRNATVAWIFSLILAVLVCTSRSTAYTAFCVIWSAEPVGNKPSIIFTCGSVISELETSHRIVEIVCFFTAFSVCFVCYSRIVHCLSTRSSNMHGASHYQARSTRNQVAKMVMINGIIFFCLGLLFQLFNIFDIMGNVLSTSESVSLLWVTRVLQAVNSSINPFIYSITNPRFRLALNEMVCQRFMKQWRRNRSLTTFSSEPQAESNL